MENQVIAHRYIKESKLKALLGSLFGTNFSVDASIPLMFNVRFEADLVYDLSGTHRLLPSHYPTEVDRGMFIIHHGPCSEANLEQDQIESITDRTSV